MKRKVIASLYIVTALVCAYIFGHRRGFEKGSDRGIEITLDTVVQIMSKHSKSRSVAKVDILNPTFDKDTVTYYLSKKTLK